MQYVIHLVTAYRSRSWFYGPFTAVQSCDPGCWSLWVAAMASAQSPMVRHGATSPAAGCGGVL